MRPDPVLLDIVNTGLTFLLFAIGLFGVLSRLKAVAILMSIELMLLAVNINLVAFSAYLQDLTGQVFTLFVLTVAAAEAAFRTTLDYVRERQAFGQPIAHFQNTRFKMADARTEIDVAQSFVDQCVLQHNEGKLSAEDAALLLIEVVVVFYFTIIANILSGLRKEVRALKARERELLSRYVSKDTVSAVEKEARGAAGAAVKALHYFEAVGLEIEYMLVDLETLEVMPRVALSTPEEVRLPLRWIGILRQYLTMSIAGSTGVHSGFDAAKLILAGADVAMTTSSLLFNGIGHLSTIENELREWMTEHSYVSVTEMRGAVSRDSAADPTAYERANYVRVLQSWKR